MKNDTTQAMPLRIAILLLANDEQLPKSLANDVPCVVELEHLSTSFKTAVELTLTNKLVCLRSQRQSLLLMPALMAAQKKLHPHAYLAAHQQSDQITKSLELALDQAKRHISKLSYHRSLDNGTEDEKFDDLCQSITDIARRTDNGQSYWFSEFHQRRYAALTLQQNSLNAANGYTTLILTQGSGLLKAKSLLDAERLFLLIGGVNQEQLKEQLLALTAKLANYSNNNNTEQCLRLMQQNLANFNGNDKPNFTIVLQANNTKALQQEVAAITNALSQIFKNGEQYRTPAGSYFTANPLGAKQLAFVYPGVGTVYQNMLDDLHLYFPELYARLEQQGDLGAMLQAETFCCERQKNDDPVSLSTLAIAGVGASYLLTRLLIDEFQIKPQFALGYSMGEVAMWASLNVWQQPHLFIEKTKTEPLFNSVISGELTAVRTAWKLDKDTPIEWNSFLVRTTATAIKALLSHYPRVYLAIDQGDSCIIAGCETSCKALLTKLGKRGIAANLVTAMHTEPALSQREQIIDFYRQPIEAAAASNTVNFISAANAAKGSDSRVGDKIGQLNSHVIASSIADTFCHPLDFNELIQSARRQGAKLFVEIGADRQNCTLIDKINRTDNQQTNCATIATNAKGRNASVSLLTAIGQLISHGIAVNLDVLQQGLNHQMIQQSPANADAVHTLTSIKGEA